MSLLPDMNLEAPCRAALRSARRVCVKAGTSVVAQKNGMPSLTRMGALVEQIGELHQRGVEVIFVSSGAVGMGKRVLRKQQQLTMTFSQLTDADALANASAGLSSKLHKHNRHSQSFASLLTDTVADNPMALPQERSKTYDNACAAAGQFEMMNLYSSLFNQVDVSASQILVTQSDFTDSAHLRNLKYAIDRLLTLGIVPIINENDAVSANQGYTEADVFSDNDSLAALCARSFDAEVLLLLTDVKGVYDSSPRENPNATLLPLFQSHHYQQISIGTKSAQGRGGMAAKIDAAISAVSSNEIIPSSGSNSDSDSDNSSTTSSSRNRDRNRKRNSCMACVVADGSDLDAVRAVLGPDPKYGAKGTLFCAPGSALEQQAIKDYTSDTLQNQQQQQQQQQNDDKLNQDETLDVSEQARNMAMAARAEARKLQALSHTVRRDILYAISTALLQHQDELLAANAIDIEAAENDNIATVLKKRLKLTTDKLTTLANGITQIADKQDPLGVVKSKRELTDGLELSLITVPIGVLMIIFESRPDSMPQISALALASGNGLLLKGGKEAKCTNAAIHKVIGDAIEAGSGGLIKRDIIALVTSRGQVKDMLSLDDVIDLVIPRGSNALVSFIKSNTKIPVLGHADGVCHIYVDSSATAEQASNLAVDAKTDYPSACNAMETLLLHKDTIQNGVAAQTLMSLRASGVKCLGGPNAMSLGLADSPAKEMKCEYGDLTCMVEVVETMDEAIDWIHRNGSGHTESIICDGDSSVGEEFLRKVDAACVFQNASTRFADGFRFGLGAEVGISTTRIHARGPVGVEGLLTTKWQLRSKNGTSHYVGEFGGEEPKKMYTHKELI